MKKVWTNQSVLALSGQGDPIVTIQDAARSLVHKGLEAGWQGPPFDPFQLAELLGYRVVPCQEVPDARLVPEGTSGYRIDFNPQQSRRRIRFSVAHELAHTLFPDCRRAVRYRMKHPEVASDNWQLEMLCNVAAGEILMPANLLPIDERKRLSIVDLINLQDEFDVSMEALLLRSVRQERRHCAAFVASPTKRGFRLDYAVESLNAGFGLSSGLTLPKDTCLSNCTAIGYTATGDEEWKSGQTLHVECVGLPSYPGSIALRVAGILYRKGDRGSSVPTITFQIGDATSPHGSGEKIIVHVVNNRARRWGNGFAGAVRRKWPHTQRSFTDWAQVSGSLSLGSCHVCAAEPGVTLVSMVTQHGYGPSPTPRIRYHGLESCLEEARGEAIRRSASVHMPRIGCGEAGGNWAVVQDLVKRTLTDHGVHVTVYDLPKKNSKPKKNLSRQGLLFST